MASTAISALEFQSYLGARQLSENNGEGGGQRCGGFGWVRKRGSATS